MSVWSGIRLWLGSLFLAIVWYVSVPIVHRDPWPVWALVVLVACGTLLLHGSQAATRRTHERCRWLAILVVAGAISIPWPYSLGGLLVGPGLALSTFRDGRVRRYAMSLLAAGCSLLLGALCTALYWRYGALIHELPWLTTPYDVVLNFLGVPASRLGGDVIVPRADGVTVLRPSLEALNGWILLCWLASVTVPVATTVHLSIGGWLRLGMAVALLPLLRSIFFDTWAMSADSIGLLWQPGVVAASMLPLAVILGSMMYPYRRTPVEFERSIWPARRPLTVVILGLLAMTCLWSGFAWAASGPRKRGRVLIDEAHSGWERTDVPMDTRNYGEATTYNYAGFRTFLSYYYDIRTNVDGPITVELLSEADVLILKTPTRAFGDDERDAIVRFVEAGGGLLLVGDHTNVFGTATYLNKIADRFGLHFRADAQYDLGTGSLTLYERPRWCPHPSVAHLPPFLFATSCTLEAGWRAEAIQVGYAMTALPADYSQENFFPAREDFSSHHPLFGVFLQTAGISVGSGRVVAFTDSTVWSNFWMFVPGKPELLLGLVDWLNRENPPIAVRHVLLLLGGLLFAVAMLVGRVQAAPLPIGIWGCVIPVLLTAWIPGVVDHRQAAEYALPEPVRHVPDVRFLTGEGLSEVRYFLPARKLQAEARPSYLTFYNWTQRVGLIPRAYPDMESACRGDALVLMLRAHQFSSTELDTLHDYLVRGGQVLAVADKATAPNYTAVLALGHMRLRWEDARRGEGGDVGPSREVKSPVKLAASATMWESVEVSVDGGEAWLSIGDRTLVATARVGDGTLIATGAGTLFSDLSLGTSRGPPSESQRELYEVEYELLRHLVPQHARARDG